MELGAVIVLAYLLIRLITYLHRRGRDQLGGDGGTGSPDTGHNAVQPSRLPVKQPFSKRVYFRIRSFISSRWLAVFELAVQYDESTLELKIKFCVPRRPLYVDVYLPASLPFTVEDVRFALGDKQETGVYGLRYISKDSERIQLRINPPRIALLDSISVVLGNIEEDFPYDVWVRTESRGCEDRDVFLAAVGYSKRGEVDLALDRFKEYCKVSIPNPYAYNQMARAYAIKEDRDKAEVYALKAATGGLSEQGVGLYRALQGSQVFLKLDEIRDLQKRYADWELDKQYGVTVLDRSQIFTLGLGRWYLGKHHELLEVKRPVAGRMLTSLVFGLSGGERLLFTSARVIDSNYQVQELELEQFTVGDSDEKNIYITVLDQQCGTWILPDLAAGDIIEWTYHILYPEAYQVTEHKPHFLVRASLAHEYHPTMLAKVEIRSPKDWQLKCKVINSIPGIVECSRQSEDSEIYVFELEHYLPIRNSNSRFGNYYLNPMVACAPDGYTWKEIAQVVAMRSLGASEAEDQIPQPLERILRDSDNPADNLAQAFYWIRDNLKYGAIESAHKNIGKLGRAQAIAESGIADCKDKSYLLHLVSGSLGLPSEYLIVSSETGLVLDDLAADQFDHVLVRVLVNDKWHYLDTANRLSVFESPPPAYQGVRALILDHNGTIDAIPIDAPNANTIEIVETFDGRETDWLTGTFQFTACGNIARLADEKMKLSSLQLSSPVQAVQSGLEQFMPSLILITQTRTSHTACSNRLQVSGTHRRCHLSVVEDRLVGTLDWREPSLPTSTWRAYDLSRLFVFYVPESIRIETVFVGNLHDRLRGFSEPIVVRNDLCDITVEIESTGASIRIVRDIVIKRKYVDQDSIHLIPETMEGIEKAFHLALFFR